MEKAHITVAVGVARPRLVEAHVVEVLVQALLTVNYLGRQVPSEMLRATRRTEALPLELFASITCQGRHIIVPFTVDVRVE